MARGDRPCHAVACHAWRWMCSVPGDARTLPRFAGVPRHLPRTRDGGGNDGSGDEACAPAAFARDGRPAIFLQLSEMSTCRLRMDWAIFGIRTCSASRHLPPAHGAGYIAPIISGTCRPVRERAVAAHAAGRQLAAAGAAGAGTAGRTMPPRDGVPALQAKSGTVAAVPAGLSCRTGRRPHGQERGGWRMVPRHVMRDARTGGSVGSNRGRDQIVDGGKSWVWANRGCGAESRRDVRTDGIWPLVAVAMADTPGRTDGRGDWPCLSAGAGQACSCPPLHPARLLWSVRTCRPCPCPPDRPVPARRRRQ